MRSLKAEALKEAHSKYGDRIEIAVVDDLVSGDFTDALRVDSRRVSPSWL